MALHELDGRNEQKSMFKVCLRYSLINVVPENAPLYMSGWVGTLIFNETGCYEVTGARFSGVACSL